MKNEKGFIVVETAISLMLFVFFVISILSLINLFTVQARVHYALTQAANTVSTYGYVLEVTGIANALGVAASKADEVTAEVSEITTQFEELLDSAQNLQGNTITQGETLANNVYSDVESAIADPATTISTLLNTGINEGQKATFEALIRPLVGRYLANGNLSGDDYLLANNVIDGLDGIEFYELSLSNFTTTVSDDSYITDSDGNLKIVANYDIEYQFGFLPLPFDAKLHVTQIVKTKLWLSGSGDGYDFD